MSTEALCQSIELLQMEVKDVKDREKNQEDMYMKIIDALKNEIENNDISKHIEIINYMHKTEVSHLKKRFDTQVEMKEKYIEQLEEKVNDLKAKNKSLETKLQEKTNEFDYYIKEENIRMKEFEFKLKSQAEQRHNFLQQLSPVSETKLLKEFEDEREKIKRQHRQQTQELKDIFASQWDKYEAKIKKSQDTVRRLTEKLTELKKFKDNEKNQLIAKLKQPCKKWRKLDDLLEEIDALKMERVDAYEKIYSLEQEINCLKYTQFTSHLTPEKTPPESPSGSSTSINLTKQDPAPQPQIYK
jgi:chromosome segregation ATPase